MLGCIASNPHDLNVRRSAHRIPAWNDRPCRSDTDVGEPRRKGVGQADERSERISMPQKRG